jgi:hypothetical protein
MRGVVRHSTGPARSRVEVRHGSHDLNPLWEAEVGRDLGPHGPDHGAGGVQWGELRGDGLQPGEAEQHGVVLEQAEVAVVRQPGGGHGGVRGGGNAREAHRQVVDRLEIPASMPRHLRLLIQEVEEVPDRVGAARRGRSPRAADPLQGGPRRVPGHRPADDLLRVSPAAAVHPELRLTDRLARVVDWDRAGPQPGDAHSDDGRRGDRTRGEPAAGGAPDGRPPLVGILYGAARTDPTGFDLFVLLPSEPAGQRDEADFRAPRPEIDGEDVPLVSHRPQIRLAVRRLASASLPCGPSASSAHDAAAEEPETPGAVSTGTAC